MRLADVDGWFSEAHAHVARIFRLPSDWWPNGAQGHSTALATAFFATAARQRCGGKGLIVGCSNGKGGVCNKVLRDRWNSSGRTHEAYQTLVDFSVQRWSRPGVMELTGESEMYGRHGVGDSVDGRDDYSWDFFKLLLVPSKTRLFMARVAGVGRMTAGDSNGLTPESRVANTKREFATFSTFWFDTHVQVNLKPSTQREYASVLRRVLVPFFGKRPIDAISSLLIDQFKGWRQQAGASAKTVNNDLSILSKLLRSAADWGFLRSTPRITFLKEAPAETHYLTPAEAQRLLEHTSLPLWRLFFFVALRTGLRAGELIGLRWEDIDLEHRVIVVRRSVVNGVVGTPKTGRFRYVAVAADLHELLTRVRKPMGYLFARPGDEPVHFATVESALQRARRKAGLPRFGLHAFRHSFASHLVMQGQDLYSVQRLLGHTDPKMTQRYAHLAPAFLRGVVDSLPRMDAGLQPLLEHRGQPVGQPVGNHGEQQANK